MGDLLPNLIAEDKVVTVVAEEVEEEVGLWAQVKEEEEEDMVIEEEKEAVMEEEVVVAAVIVNVTVTEEEEVEVRGVKAVSHQEVEGRVIVVEEEEVDTDKREIETPVQEEGSEVEEGSGLVVETVRTEEEGHRLPLALLVRMPPVTVNSLQVAEGHRGGRPMTITMIIKQTLDASISCRQNVR